MPKVKCLNSIAIMGHAVFEAGNEYEITDELFTEHPTVFEKSKATKTKKDASKADENK
tara:strand:+ start:314 stop:487 length:174 start_codon:yes stop_codon:yes gene_type:complete